MIEFYNTLTRKKEEFKPIWGNKVGLYVCGPTVYDYPHLGNLRTYIFSDILRRVLEMNKFAVTEIMNITDVGHLTSDEDTGIDKMEKGAQREKLSVWELAEKYQKIFKANLNELNILTPTKFVRATENIKVQINYIKKIENRGFTYKINDGIYFDTARLKNYGRLGGLNVFDKEAIARIEPNPEKKNPADFALWKYSPKNPPPGKRRQMEWPSPWGTGFPGWHIECSAMSQKYLGSEFDIHVGGVDHIRVHHNNEIAQSEAVFSKIPARFWLHGEFLLVEGRKMAKSAGTFLTLEDIKSKGFEPLSFRYLTLTSHYRSKLDFSFESLKAAAEALKNINRLKNNNSNLNSDISEKYRQKIQKALNDDLDTPKALAQLHKANDFSLWLEFERILALGLDKEKILPDKINELIKVRNEARHKKDFQKADKIRREIEEEGFTVEDSEDGTKVS